jgi:hypothetical protein
MKAVETHGASMTIVVEAFAVRDPKSISYTSGTFMFSNAMSMLALFICPNGDCPIPASPAVLFLGIT